MPDSVSRSSGQFKMESAERLIIVTVGIVGRVWRIRGIYSPVWVIILLSYNNDNCSACIFVELMVESRCTKNILYRFCQPRCFKDYQDAFKERQKF
mgnify:CR=1 FL=1